MSAAPFYEAGTHIGVIVGQGLAKAKTGTDQFVLEVKVLSFFSAAGAVAHEKQYSRTIYMALTEKTVDFVGHTLRTLGYRYDSFGPLDPSHPSHHSFVGRTVELYCQHESYQGGAPREKWRINVRKSLDLKPLRAEEVASLDRRFASALGNKTSAPEFNEQDRAAAPDSEDHVGSTEITDDDIPF